MGKTPHYTTDYTTLSGYGLKLLEKQGFKTGSGLGKTQVGTTEIIHVVKKNDAMGVGATHKVEDKWWERLYDASLKSSEKKPAESSSSSDDDEKEILTMKRYKQKGKQDRIKKAEARLLSQYKKPKI